jgi:tRNA U34 5-methylaminomethyl-2-thiouridine-forming methyltransferase MnmC
MTEEIRRLNSLPAHHQLVRTEDGSYSLFSELYGEATHSRSGAKLETQLHYIQGCHISGPLSQGKLFVFEVGFGTGLGWRETLAYRDAHYPSAFVCFISVEKQIQLLPWVCSELQPMQPPFDHWYAFKQPLAELYVYGGDALTLSKNDIFTFTENQPVHAIYQDAFSPKRNPELWSKDWFTFCASLSGPQTRLATYSSSQSVQANLQAADWCIEKGPGFGPKRSSTRATLSPSSTSLK